MFWMRRFYSICSKKEEANFSALFGGDFAAMWIYFEWQTKLADHYLVAVLCGPMGEEHLRLFHKGREFFAFPPTSFGTSLGNNCGHYSWPPARDAQPLSLTPTGSLKFLLPDWTDSRNICPVWFDQWPLKCFFYGRDLFLFVKIFLWKKSLIWHVTDKNILERPKTGLVTTSREEEVNGAKIPVCQVVVAQFPETSCTTQPCFQTSLREKTRTAVSARHPPVTRLETTRGKISIFSILIRISPGKAMIITTSGGRGDMCRSSIPAMEPRKTPAPQREREGRDTDAVRGKKNNKTFEHRGTEYDNTTCGGSRVSQFDPQITSSESPTVSPCDQQLLL